MAKIIEHVAAVERYDEAWLAGQLAAAPDTVTSHGNAFVSVTRPRALEHSAPLIREPLALDWGANT